MAWVLTVTPGRTAARAPTQAPSSMASVHLDSQNRLDRLSYADAALFHVALDLGDLGIDQVAVPEPLEEMESGPSLSVKKAKPEHVAVEEVGKGAEAAGETRIDNFLEPALHSILLSAAQGGNRVALHETVFQVEQVNRLAAGVFIVLVGPPT